MTAKAKMTDLVLQVRVENGTKADGKAAVININFNQLKLDATDQQLLDAGHAAAGLQSLSQIHISDPTTPSNIS